jgi:hypothetical protein
MSLTPTSVVSRQQSASAFEIGAAWPAFAADLRLVMAGKRKNMRILICLR